MGTCWSLGVDFSLRIWGDPVWPAAAAGCQSWGQQEDWFVRGWRRWRRWQSPCDRAALLLTLTQQLRILMLRGPGRGQVPHRCHLGVSHTLQSNTSLGSWWGLLFCSFSSVRIQKSKTSDCLQAGILPVVTAWGEYHWHLVDKGGGCCQIFCIRCPHCREWATPPMNSATA